MTAITSEDTPDGLTLSPWPLKCITVLDTKTFVRLFTRVRRGADSNRSPERLFREVSLLKAYSLSWKMVDARKQTYNPRTTKATPKLEFLIETSSLFAGFPCSMSSLLLDMPSPVRRVVTSHQGPIFYFVMCTHCHSCPPRRLTELTTHASFWGNILYR